MKLSRKQLRRLIAESVAQNESIFGMRPISASPTLGALGILTPSERKKVAACKRADEIIKMQPGGVSTPDGLYKALHKIIDHTGAYYKAEKKKGRGKVTRKDHYGGFLGFDDVEPYLAWMSTRGRELNPSRGRKSGFSSRETFRFHIPEDFFTLIPLLHEISKPDITYNDGSLIQKILGVFRGDDDFGNQPVRPPKMPDYEDFDQGLEADAYQQQIQSYHDSRREDMTNLERNFAITIPGEPSVVSLLGQYPDADKKRIFSHFFMSIRAVATGGTLA
tara:strand:- start:107 stop:937 length:831 start_codon:yes stop_codon:yes gene_type:complete